jgi:hypothetical protein
MHLIGVFKTGLTILCLLVFCGTGFAQFNDLKDIGNAESSKMSKTHGGLISSTEMQAYEQGLVDQYVGSDTSNVPADIKGTPLNVKDLPVGFKGFPASAVGAKDVSEKEETTKRR